MAPAHPLASDLAWGFLFVWGTLSHFDTASLPLSDDEFELLKSAAKLMPSFLIEH